MQNKELIKGKLLSFNKMKTINILFLVAILIVTSCTLSFSQNNETFTITEVQKEQIEAYLEKIMDQANIPGMSVAIVHKEGVLYSQSFGKTGHGNAKVNEHTPFILGSISKSFTSLAIKQLEASGKLVADAPVSRYLEWFTIKKEDGSEITINELMSHTSGFLSGAGEQAYIYNADYTIETLAKRINQLEYSDFPEEADEQINDRHYQFSNINYILLGAIVESVSQMSFEAYMQENIYTPLQMNESYTDYKTAYSAGLARGYRVLYGFVVKSEMDFPKALIPSNYLMSSITDLSKYTQVLLNNGETTNGSSIVTQTPFEIQDASIQDEYLDSKWDLISERDANNYNGYYGVFGALPNYNSALLVNPDLGLGIVVLTNLANYYETPSISAQTIGNDLTDLLINKAPYEFETGENLGLWLLLILSIGIIIMMIRRFMKLLHQLKDSREIVKVFEFNETVRGLASLIIYIGFPILQDNDGGYFVSSNPDYVLPVFLLVVVNLLLMIAGFTVKFMTNSKRRKRV